MHEHFDPHCVAEVIVGARRGSGYRVDANTILTAAHVVAGAGAITVRCDAGVEGEWAAEATVAWSDPDSDLALLECVPPAHAATVAPARFGALPDRRAVIDVHAAGFPRFKWRSTFRDLHDVSGTLSLLSNRRSGTLEVTVAAPAADPEGFSPWEGMSGAALWARGRIIGVVTAHHPREGLGRLTATRIDRAARFAVDDVLDGPPGWMSRSGYVEQVRDIAPVGGLIGREAELDELARFCAGEESYVYWQAGPWSGKSALMSAFVLDPPDGVDVVSFFVTARLAGQADSTAFTEALVEQLSCLIGEAAPPARDHNRRALLKAAAEHCRRAGRRLVLVVDGMDEDAGATPGGGLASIASLLPKQPGDDLRIVLSGRPAPPIPSDVGEDHPIRTCRVRQLAVSPYAVQTARMARRELDELLTGDHAQREVIGLITACGGGLSLPELEELTRLPRFDLDRILGGVFGRTIAGRGDGFLFTHETLRVEALSRLGSVALEGYRARIHQWAVHYGQWPAQTPPFLLRGYPRMLHAAGDADRLVALATDRARHERLLEATGGDGEALAEIALAQSLGPGTVALARLAVHRQRLSARNANVPADLPRLWAMLGQPQRAESLAHSIASPQRRTEALTSLIRSGHDSLADAAVAAAQLIADPGARFEAHAEVVKALCDTGRPDAAEAVARVIADADWRELALTAVVGALVRAGEGQRAHGLAESMSNPCWQAQSLAALGLFDAALGVAYVVPDPYWRAEALGMIAAASRIDRVTAMAIEVAQSVEHPVWRARALRRIVARLEPTARHRARALAAAFAEGRRIIDDAARSRALTELVALARGAGEQGCLVEAAHYAAKAASRLDDVVARDQALVALAAEVACSGALGAMAAAAPFMLLIGQATELSRARLLLGGTLPRSAGRLRDETVGLIEPWEGMTGVGLAMLAAGDHASAGELAQRATALSRSADSVDTDRLLVPLVVALVGVGENDRAEAACSAITNGQAQIYALTLLRTRQGRIGEAMELTRNIDDTEARVHALAELTRVLVSARRMVEARACVQDAAAAVRAMATPKDPPRRSPLQGPSVVIKDLRRPFPATVRLDLAEAHAMIDDFSGAQTALRRSAMLPPSTQIPGAALVWRLVTAGEFGRARTVADLVPADHGKVDALLALATALTEAGRRDEAAEAVRAAVDAAAVAVPTESPVSGLTRVALASMRLGLRHVAENLLERAADALPEADEQHLRHSIGEVVDLATALARVDRGSRAMTVLERASTLVVSVGHYQPVPMELGKVALAWVSIGDRDRAAALLDWGVQAVARTVPDPRSAVSLAAVAAALGRPDQARVLLELVVGDEAHSGWAATSCIQAARQFAALGLRDRATQVLDAVGRGLRDAKMVSSYESAVELLFELGEPERARRVFDDLVERGRRGPSAPEILRNVAASMTRAGQAELAVLAVDAIGDQGERRRVLKDLGPGVVVRALETLPWADVVPALARWDVPALLALADEVNPSGVDGP